MAQARPDGAPHILCQESSSWHPPLPAHLSHLTHTSLQVYPGTELPGRPVPAKPPPSWQLPGPGPHARPKRANPSPRSLAVNLKAGLHDWLTHGRLGWESMALTACGALLLAREPRPWPVVPELDSAEIWLKAWCISAGQPQAAGALLLYAACGSIVSRSWANAKRCGHRQQALAACGSVPRHPVHRAGGGQQTLFTCVAAGDGVGKGLRMPGGASWWVKSTANEWQTWRQSCKPWPADAQQDWSR